MWFVVIHKPSVDHILNEYVATVYKPRHGIEMMNELRRFKDIKEVWPFDTKKEAEKAASEFEWNPAK